MCLYTEYIQHMHIHFYTALVLPILVLFVTPLSFILDHHIMLALK